MIIELTDLGNLQQVFFLMNQTDPFKNVGRLRPKIL